MPSWDKVESDIERGPGGLFKWIAIGVLAFVLLGSAIYWVTAPAGKAVDRMIQKNSFQYKEGMEQRAAILEASIVELDIQIRNAGNDKARQGLIDQKTIIRAQLRAITIND